MRVEDSVCYLFLSQTGVAVRTWTLSTFMLCGVDCDRYVSVMGNHVVNPVITPSGLSGTVTGVLAAGLVGPDYHLSPVWTPINMQLGANRPGLLLLWRGFNQYMQKWTVGAIAQDEWGGQPHCGYMPEQIENVAVPILIYYT